MPFTKQVIAYINTVLTSGSLNNAKLQPVHALGIAESILRPGANGGPMQSLPAILLAPNSVSLIAPDDKYGIQFYHRMTSKTYTYEKKSFGDKHVIRSVVDASIIVFSNLKKHGLSKNEVEPAFIFGLPQKLSAALQSELKIDTCIITPVSSNLDHTQVFRQEYPNTEFFLNENMSMFLLKYRIDTKFGQDCVDHCLCNN